MTHADIEHYSSSLVGSFPNTYCYTKRMAEHLLTEANTTGIPLLIIRPSIIGAAFQDPVPGWTDSLGMAGGIFLLGGLGILKDLPGDAANIGDFIPVDFVANQILITLPQIPSL